ncbi:MAG: VWA domain-containing protein [Gammaproteobacteria bacterium]|nr:VWA domain-containing protein [Gammaproteobacteria bacterium]
MKYFLRLIAVVLLTASFSAAAEPSAVKESRRNIDIVIALDVSGSMSGLIDSARARLWDVVNTFSRAQPQPQLRVGIVSYGNPNYGAGSGYVRVDQPLTADLDSVNETLFAFGTNGGDEYVSRAIATSIDKLQWSQSSDAMRVIFVAGNESAEQAPVLSLNDVLAQATEHGITVNSIYCGAENDSVASAWRQIAFNTQGAYASIDQTSNVIAQIETPMDVELAELSAELNNTYIPYGDEGEVRKERQQEQDDNAEGMSLGALASRVVTKASALYQNAKWDLVDAFEQGTPMSDIPPAALPAPLQDMPLEEVEEIVAEQSQKRAELKQKIADLDAGRRDYVEAYRSAEGAAGLDAALAGALKKQAEEQGFVVE